jgi:hypothetical protein
MVIGGGVQPTRSFTLCSTATPIRLAIIVTMRHLAPARPGGPTLPILIVVSTLAARMSVSVVSPALCARDYPGQQASQFPQGWNHTAAEPHPECHHRERDRQPHGWQSDAADGDDRATLTATHAFDSTGGASGSSDARLRIPVRAGMLKAPVSRRVRGFRVPGKGRGAGGQVLASVTAGQCDSGGHPTAAARSRSRPPARGRWDGAAGHQHPASGALAR